MNNPVKMGEDALKEVKELVKQLRTRNVLELANVRHQAYLDGKHLVNGAEMDDEEYWSCIEELWNSL